MTNITIIVGRLACDPETNKTPAGKRITHICVVTDRPARDKDGKSYKDDRGFTARDSEFHRVTCFGGLGKTVARLCAKGQMVSIKGRLHYSQWQDHDGITRYGCEILADEIQFLTRGVGGSMGEEAEPA